MTFIDIFSKRMKRKNQEKQSDIYQYEYIPKELRVQIIFIWNSAIGKFQKNYGPYSPRSNSFGNEAWPMIHNSLAREYGIFTLSDGSDPFVRCKQFILDSDISKVLDIVELSFRIIDVTARQIDEYDRKRRGITQSPDDAIKELNHRFREHKVGYQFENGEIMKVDSHYIHDYAVKPAISLLLENDFYGAEEEFMKAHEHYREGRYKEAIQDANNSFESVMKTICELNNWEYSKNATASPLIQILFDNKLIPDYLQQEFNSLISLIKSGVPTLRNKTAGHGQGTKPKNIPEHLATYSLHLLAANIVFLVKSHLERK